MTFVFPSCDVMTTSLSSWGDAACFCTVIRHCSPQERVGSWSAERHFHYTGEKAASLLLISYKLGNSHFKQCGWMNSATGDRNNMKSLYQNPSSRIRRRLFYSTRCFAVYQITCSFFQSHKRLFSSFPHMQSDSPTPVNTLMCVNVWMSGCCRRWRFHFRLTSSIQVVFQSSSPSRLMIRFR